MIELKSIGVQFHEKWVLKDVNLSLNPGEILTLVGPNGAGKTTLVKVLAGLLTPSQGSRLVSPGTKIGYMPQKLNFDPILPLTVEQFLKLSPNARELNTSLEAVGIAHLLTRQMTHLSGGECQRVLLTRALMSKPDFLILDEPNQGVDWLGQADLYQLLHNVRDQHHCGIVMVSHDLHFVMAQTDKVVCLNQHVCCEGTPEMITQDPAFVHLFGEISGLARYTHRHDHHHTLEGQVMRQDKDASHD